MSDQGRSPRSDFTVYTIRPAIRETPLVIVASLAESWGLVSEYFLCLNDKEQSYFSSRLTYNGYSPVASAIIIDAPFMHEQARIEAESVLCNYVRERHPMARPSVNIDPELCVSTKETLLRFHLRGMFQIQFQKIVKQTGSDELSAYLRKVLKTPKIDLQDISKV